MGPGRSREESAMPNRPKGPDIYPPSIFDPLLPGGIPSKPDGTAKPAPAPDAVARDRYLGELAKENMGVDPAAPGADQTVHIKFTVSDAPCATCGKYMVLPGEHCPGCGAVR